MTISPISPSGTHPGAPPPSYIQNLVKVLTQIQNEPNCPPQIPVFLSNIESQYPSTLSLQQQAYFTNAIQICATMLQNEESPSLLFGLNQTQYNSLTTVFNPTTFPDGENQASDYQPLMQYAYTLMNALSESKNTIIVPAADLSFLQYMQGASGADSTSLIDSLQTQEQFLTQNNIWAALPKTTQTAFSMFVESCTDNQSGFPINN